MTEKTATTQVYRIVIKASAQAIWDAITRPEWTERYGYGGRVEYELKPGGRYCHNASAEMKSMGPLRQPLRCARLWRQRDVAWGKRFTKGWPPR
jgi:hypothetical protein